MMSDRRLVRYIPATSPYSGDWSWRCQLPRVASAWRATQCVQQLLRDITSVCHILVIATPSAFDTFGFMRLRVRLRCARGGRFTRHQGPCCHRHRLGGVWLGWSADHERACVGLCRSDGKRLMVYRLFLGTAVSDFYAVSHGARPGRLIRHRHSISDRCSCRVGVNRQDGKHTPLSRVLCL